MFTIEARYRWAKTREWFGPRLAGRLPRRLVYWALIRAGVHATTGRWSNQLVPELTFFEALERWSKD